MGPWPLPQNFNGPFRKLMGHIINPMGHSLHAFFGFESCATELLKMKVRKEVLGFFISEFTQNTVD
jgi:hypothetical protein